MSADERRRILGDAVIAHIRDEVAKAPPPPPGVLDALRPILTRPAVPARPVRAARKDRPAAA